MTNYDMMDDTLLKTKPKVRRQPHKDVDTDVKEKYSFGHDLKPFQRWLYVIAGSVSVGLGTLGIVLPLLPTTPFLLLAAYCYAKSSERFYTWLITNRYFGEYIRNYREKNGVPMKIKVYTLILLWATICFSAFYVVSLIWVRIILMVIATGVTIHVLSIKTLHKSKEFDGKNNDG